jgi:predicted Zn finger-like uncharacterized protein
MFTVCPKCTLTLVVTTVDLRAGQGYVRCGRCANVFNALIALREGDPSGSTSDTANRRLQETAPKPPVDPALGAGVADRLPEPEPEPEPPPESEPEVEARAEPEPEAEPEAEPEQEAESIADLETESALEEPSLEFDAAATDVSEIFISPSDEEQTGSGTFESVVLGEETPAPEMELEPGHAEDDASHTDTIAAGDWSLLDDEPPADAESVIEESPLTAATSTDDETTGVETAPSDPPWVEEMFAEAEAEVERSRTAEVAALAPEAPAAKTPRAKTLRAESITAEDDEPALVEAARASTGSAAPSDTVLEPLLGEPATRRPSWQYISGIGALVLLLAIQVLHFNRQNLLLSDTFRPAVNAVYGWFGVTLTPPWDLAAYSVKQLGAEAEGGEGTRLRVRLSLQNESQHVQPLPLLRLTLQDRYGNAVATRDLEPSDYLPPRAADQRLLEPDQRIDAELHVIDPGRAAIGFEIDACLRGEGGAIGCANDARRRTAG